MGSLRGEHLEEEAEDLAEELEAEGARAGPAEQAEQDDDVAEVVAEERSPVLGTQELEGSDGEETLGAPVLW